MIDVEEAADGWRLLPTDATVGQVSLGHDMRLVVYAVEIRWRSRSQRHFGSGTSRTVGGLISIRARMKQRSANSPSRCESSALSLEARKRPESSLLNNCSSSR
jgi:hypothetical protein